MSTVVEILNDAKSFWDKHIYNWGESWNAQYKLSDIVKKSGHGKWISFKDGSISARSVMLNELVNARNIEITKQIVRKILTIYKDIIEFIKERRTDIPEEDVDHHMPEGIAVELKHVLTDSVITISEIMGDDPCIRPEESDSEQIEFNTGDFDTDRGKALLQGLANAGLVEKSGGRFTWLKAANLYGYFVDESSRYLSLRSSNKRIPSSKYECLFTNHSQLLASARTGVNDYTNGSQVKPEVNLKLVTREMQQSRTRRHSPEAIFDIATAAIERVSLKMTPIFFRDAASLRFFLSFLPDASSASSDEGDDEIEVL